MGIYITKKDKTFLKNYTKVFDNNGKFLKLLLILMLVLILIGFFSVDFTYYIESLNPNDVPPNDRLWNDRFTLIIVPAISTLLLTFSFYNDYKDKSYRLMMFLNKGLINRSILYRFIGYLIIIVISQYISILLKYREVISGVDDMFHLAFRFIPPLLFLTTLGMAMLVTFKNIYSAVIGPISYLLIDIFTGGRLFRIFTMYDMDYLILVHNEYYKSKIILCIMTILFLFIIIRNSKLE